MKEFGLCSHPELQMGHREWPKGPKPEAAMMVGLCEHNVSCLTCGWGWGQAPDPCSKTSDEARNIQTGISGTWIGETGTEAPTTPT